MREAVRVGLAIATAATMHFSGEMRPVYANLGATELTRVTPVFEPHTEIDARDAEAFRALMGDILNPVVNPQVFNDNLTSPRFKVQSTPDGKGYIYRPKSEAGTAPDIIWAIVNNNSDLVQFEVSLNPEGQIAKADPRVQYSPESLIAGVNKALKNAPENWRN